MEVLDMALAIIRLEEGFRPRPYLDSEGFWTVGYGTKIGWADMVNALDVMKMNGEQPPLFDKKLLMVMSIERVKVDYAKLKPQSFFCDLNKERQAVLLSMVYQLGYAGLMGFERMRKALKRGEFNEAAKEALDSKWARQTPARALRAANAIRLGVVNLQTNEDWLRSHEANGV